MEKRQVILFHFKPALVQVAHAAVKDKKNPYYALKYERIAKRRGKKRAIIAIVRMILIAIYSMFFTGEVWNPVDLFKIDMPEHLKEQQLAKAIKQATRFLEKQGLLICGHCGTPYRRCTWSKNGKKKIVWRCISRLDYGKKYCSESPSIEESVLQKAIVDCIKQVVQDESGYAAIENLKLHVGMYFDRDDENSTVEDEARVKELIQAITEAASSGEYSAEMQSMVDELNRIKSIITEKKAKQTSAEKSAGRLDEILEAVDLLKDRPIEFNNQAIRKLIECIKVISKDEIMIMIMFKGGIKKGAILNNLSSFV